jgi:hypothetical protein
MTMVTQIPVIVEKPLVSCVKKAHDWTVEQLADYFRTTHKVKTQQHVTKSRGRHCGDIELVVCLPILIWWCTRRSHQINIPRDIELAVYSADEGYRVGGLLGGPDVFGAGSLHRPRPFRK